MTEVLAEACSILPWDSEFFGRRIARVQSNRLSPVEAQQVEDWATANQIECLYLLARADCPITIKTAQQFGFGLIDIRMTFEAEPGTATDASIRHPRSASTIRPAESGDLPVLQQIARVSHRDSRFFTDVHFPIKRSEELFATWIRRDYEGRAQKLFVAVSELNEPEGYISCHLELEERLGQIGLVGVGEKCRGRGVGSSLVRSAIGWFASEGAARVEVVTQGRNVAAQRLYQRCGFVTKDVQLWFHKWFESSRHPSL